MDQDTIDKAIAVLAVKMEAGEVSANVTQEMLTAVAFVVASLMNPLREDGLLTDDRISATLMRLRRHC